MKLSVIIPCLNAAETIGVQLEALAQQNFSEPWEVIVSDNGSTDGSRKVIEKFKGGIPNIQVVDSSKRPWANYARNVGARVARSHLIAFLDADDEVHHEWARNMSEALDKHAFVASCIEFHKLNPSWLANSYKSHPQLKGLQRTWYPPYQLFAGAGTLGIRKTLHDKIHGFDESLPRLQDVDYCFRIQMTGENLHFVPDAIVHLRCRQTIGGVFHQSRLWGKYNVLMYKRYRHPGQVVPNAWRRYGLAWLNLARNIHRLGTLNGQVNWFKQAGWQIGMLQGSLKYKVSPIPF